MTTPRTALIYALHSARLNGTERMALATLEALRDEFDPVWIAPPGEATEVARDRGYAVFEVRGRRATAVALDRVLRRAPRVALLATTVAQSLMFDALRRVHPRTPTAHLHVVHGGAEEPRAYGNKRLLRRLPVDLIAVSDYVRGRLVAHGAQPDRITVIGNFVERERAARLLAMPLRHRPLARVAMVTRLDPIKRVDRLFDALDIAPDLAGVRVDIFGSGSELPAIEARAARHPNVRLHGHRPDAADRLDAADALIHTCDREPFGLAVQEAMLAGLPVIVPDRGGAASLVEPGRTGVHCAVEAPAELAAALRALVAMPADQRAALGERARAAAAERAAATLGAAAYRSAIERAFARKAPALREVGGCCRRTVAIDGVPIDALGFDATLLRIAGWLDGTTPRRVATANTDFLLRCKDDAELAGALASADLVTADGFPLVVASRLAGDPLPERVTGADLVAPLVAAAARRGRSVFLLGGAPGIAERAAKLLTARHPRLRIAGTAAPRVDLADRSGCARIAAEVYAAETDLLIVALGCPKQELFLARHLAATGARVGIGVGASLDFLVGAVRRAPRWVQRARLEWLFRALTEPRRLGPRYARNLPFVVGLWWRAWRQRRPAPTATPRPSLQTARSR